MAIDQEALDVSQCRDCDPNAENGSQNGSQSHTVHPWSRDKAFSVQGSVARPEELESPTF